MGGVDEHRPALAQVLVRDVVTQIPGEVDVGAGRTGGAEQGITGAAAQGDAPDLGLRIAGGPHTPLGGGQAVGDESGERGEGGGLVEIADPSEPGVLRPGAGSGVVDEDVHRGHLVRVPGHDRAPDRGAQLGRGHELDAGLGDLFGLADGADTRVGAVAGPEAPGAAHGERALGVAAHPSGPGGEDRVQEVVEVVVGHGHHPPVDGAVAGRCQGGAGGEPEGVGEGVVDAGPRGVGVGVRGVQGAAAGDEAVQQASFGRVGGHGVHAAQQRRVVDEQQVGALGEGVVDDGVGRVHRHDDTRDLGGGVAGDQADAVPRLGQARWVGPLQQVDHVGQGGPAGGHARSPSSRFRAAPASACQAPTSSSTIVPGRTASRR